MNNINERKTMNIIKLRQASWYLRDKLYKFYLYHEYSQILH